MADAREADFHAPVQLCSGNLLHFHVIYLHFVGIQKEGYGASRGRQLDL